MVAATDERQGSREISGFNGRFVFPHDRPAGRQVGEAGAGDDHTSPARGTGSGSGFRGVDARRLDRINHQNARKMVLYLARHEPEERTRRQIREDLGLTMTEAELEKRLKQLVMAGGGCRRLRRPVGDYRAQGS